MSLIRPAPIRTDVSNAFAHDTMIRRVPSIVDDILARNPDYPKVIAIELKNLGWAIRENKQIHPLKPTGFGPRPADYDDWMAAVEVREGDSWLNTDWFFAETYFYRQIMERVQWDNLKRDPFAPNKAEEYASESLWRLMETALTVQGTPVERLTQALSLSLWGNQIDLSFEASRQHGTMVGEDDLLVDDSLRTVHQLLNGRGAVHFVIDNAGTELAMDLVLVDMLLDGIVDQVILHLKAHPTFVSDAMVADVNSFFKTLYRRGGLAAELGERLGKANYAGRLKLSANYFWNSCHFMWSMPRDIRLAFRDARLVIVKGDANYRRLVGDAIWPADEPFTDVMKYFPAPLVALRTLKSDPLIGLPTGMAEQLDAVDQGWRVNGRRGVIQFKL